MDNVAPIAEPEGGDPPCWSHLFDDEEGGLIDRAEAERSVRAPTTTAPAGERLRADRERLRADRSEETTSSPTSPDDTAST